MEPDFSKYLLEGDNSAYAGERPRRPGGDPRRARGRQHRPVRRRDPHLRREHPAHAGHQALVRQGAATRPATGRSPTTTARPRPAATCCPDAPASTSATKFEDYVDMEEGDWVFVPPFMPHVECNLSRTEPLIWMTTRTPENIVVNLPEVDRRGLLRDWLDPSARDAPSQPQRCSPPRSPSSRPSPSTSTWPSPRSPSRARGPRRTAATWSRSRGRRRMRSVTDGKRAALHALLLHAARRHRRRGPLRGGAAARRPRLQHPAGPRLPERQAGLRVPWPASPPARPAAPSRRQPAADRPSRTRRTLPSSAAYLAADRWRAAR